MATFIQFINECCRLHLSAKENDDAWDHDGMEEALFLQRREFGLNDHSVLSLSVSQSAKAYQTPLLLFAPTPFGTQTSSGALCSVFW